MLTLKQAFSVAALQQNSRTQSQQCDSCPLQQLHKLCDRIEGETSTVCHGYHVLSLYQPIPLSYCIPLFLHLSEVLSNKPSSAHIHIYYQISWYTKEIVQLKSTIVITSFFSFFLIIKGDILKNVPSTFSSFEKHKHY